MQSVLIKCEVEICHSTWEMSWIVGLAYLANEQLSHHSFMEVSAKKENIHQPI